MRALNSFPARALACALTWASVTPTVAEEPQRGGILPFAIVAEPPTYDCHGTQTFAVLQRVAPHYSTLLRFEPNNYPNVVADVAESWSASPDQLTFTFKLRPNVKFHDGSDFDLGGREGHLRAHQQSTRGCHLDPQGLARQGHRRDRYARSTTRSCSA